MLRPLSAGLSLLLSLSAVAAEAPAAAPVAAVKPQAAELARLMVSKEDWSRAMEGISKDTMGQFQGHPGSKMTLPGRLRQEGARRRGEGAARTRTSWRCTPRSCRPATPTRRLEELIAFHKSPLGQKYFKVAPVEAEKVAAQSQQRFAKQMPEIMKKLSADLPHPDPKKSGQAHPQAGGMPASHPAMPPADGKAAPAAKPAPGQAGQ